MKRIPTFLASAVALFACMFAFAVRAQDTPPNPRATAVNALRLLNTAQVTYHHQSGHFAISVSELAALIDTTTAATATKCRIWIPRLAKMRWRVSS